MCVVQDRLKRATVGPLPGVTQDIAGFKVKPYFVLSRFVCFVLFLKQDRVNSVVTDCSST